MTWRDFAPCRAVGAEVMFAPDFTDALNVCDQCPRWVRQACYDANRPLEEWGKECFGVIGGVPAHQRTRLPVRFRVPLIPRRFLPSTNPSIPERTIRSLNNPQPITVDADGFQVRRPAGNQSGPLKACPSFGAIVRHREAGELCEVCNRWRRENRPSRSELRTRKAS